MAALPPIVVIAGGLGTRLYPVTKTIPKSLVEVGGIPFIDHQLKLFTRRGLREAVFCIGHIGEQIETYLTDHGAHGLKVRFSRDGETLRGTGGAVRNALPLLGDVFFVTYGDSYLDIDYTAVSGAFAQSDAAALMTVFRNEDSWDRSNVEFDGQRVVVYDKKTRTPQMHYIDYGLLLMRSSCFAHCPERFDLADLLTPLAAQRKLAGMEVRNRFYEVGSTRGIADLERYLKTSP